MPKFGFTEHAIDRFIDRHAPDLSRAEARKYLEQTALKAVRLKEKTINGQAQWQIEDGVVLVTKSDNGENVCVTILPEPQHRGPGSEELEMMRQYAEAHPDTRPHRPLPPHLGLKRAEHRQFFEMALSDRQLRKMLHIARLDASRSKQQEKTKRHQDHQSLEVEKLRSLLRIALRALTGYDGTTNGEALEEVRSIEPNFLTDNFLAKKAS